MESNEVIFSQFISNTLGGRGETYLIVGTAIEPKLQPRSCQLGFIKAFKFVQNGTQLQLVH
jgi:splicing factor 3B subunit 3